MISVLELHPGDEDVLSRCSSCLASLSCDAAAALQIAEEGGVAAVLASIDANPDLDPESVAGGVGMIEAVMSNPAAFSKVADQDLVDKVVSVMGKHLESPAISLSCVRVLEKVAKTAEGLAMIQASGGVKMLLSSLSAAAARQIHGEEDADLVVRATKVLGRVARTSAVIREIKGGTGVDVYLKVLEAFPEDER